MNSLFLQNHSIKQLGVPYDANTPVAATRVDMRKCKQVAFVVAMSDSVAAVVAFALKQHNAASGGTTKALPTRKPYFYKAGTDLAKAFTKVDQGDTENDTFDLSAQFAGEEGVAVFHIHEEDLDTNGNFTHASIEPADTTAAKTLSILAIIEGNNLPAYSEVY